MNTHLFHVFHSVIRQLQSGKTLYLSLNHLLWNKREIASLTKALSCSLSCMQALTLWTTTSQSFSSTDKAYLSPSQVLHLIQIPLCSRLTNARDLLHTKIKSIWLEKLTSIDTWFFRHFRSYLVTFILVCYSQRQDKIYDVIFCLVL